MKVLYVCFWSALTGYGRAARDYVAALHAAGHQVTVVDWSSLDPARTASVAPPEEPRYQHLDGLVAPWPATEADRDGGHDAIICHGQPRLLAAMAAKGITRSTTPMVAMTTWETSAFPPEYGHGLEDFAAVIVPSAWCKEVIDTTGTGLLDVHVVPHTFDPAFWAPQAPPPWLVGTSFYTLGAWSERKNPAAILKAYLHAFDGRGPNKLTIAGADIDLAAVRSIIARSGLQQHELPAIEIRREVMTESQIRELHASHDVFVSASRGEAWGLPLFEAACMGKVVIAPCQTGEEDYLIYPKVADDDLTYRGLLTVEATATPSFAGAGAPVIHGGQVVGVHATAVPGMNCKQTWHDVDVCSLAQAMKIDHAQLMKHRASAPHDYFGPETLAHRFGYASVAPLLIETLEKIA